MKQTLREAGTGSEVDFMVGIETRAWGSLLRTTPIAKSGVDVWQTFALNKPFPINLFPHKGQFHGQ